MERFKTHNLLWAAGLFAVVATTAFAAPAKRQQVRKLSPEEVKRLPATTKFFNLNDVLGGRRVIPSDAAQPPLLFETNVGQADPGFALVLRSVNFAVGLKKNGVTAVVAQSRSRNAEPAVTGGHSFALEFRGANATALAGANPVKANVNVLLGRGSGHYKQVPAFKSAVYKNLYPGVQMLVAGQGGKLEYGFKLEPTATLSDIKIDVKGVSSVAIDTKGNLRMKTGTGTLVQTKPRFSEIGPDGPRERQGRFILLGKTTYGFAVDSHTKGTKLYVDPEIVFASYFGGSKNEGTLEPEGGASDLHGAGFDIAVGTNGNAHIVGTTLSTDFPISTNGPVSVSTDSFALRLDPSRPVGDWLVYSTVIGGTGFERGVAVAPMPDGSAYLTGCTTSSDFPTSVGVLQQTREQSVAYVVRLTPTGAFDIGTLVGRKVVHHPSSIAYTNGSVYLAGSVAKPPDGTLTETVPGAFQTTYRGGSYDGFVAKLDASLTHLEYSTLIGGMGTDIVRDLAVMNNGHVYVTGATASIDFPTTQDVILPTHSQAARTDCAKTMPPRQCFDAFVTSVRPDGTALKYSTFYYVPGGEREEYARGIAVGSDNRATMTGAAKSTSDDKAELVIVRLDGSGDNFRWERRLPGLRFDHGEEVVVDALQRAHVVGTSSRDGLATGEASLFHGGKSDIFYARIKDDNEGTVDFFTYFGGSGEDRGFAVAAQGTTADNFCAWSVGSTASQDAATVDSIAGGEENRGGTDVLIHLLCDSIGIVDLQKNPSHQEVSAGELVEFDIVLNNPGDLPVAVKIEDHLPSDLALVSVNGAGCVMQPGNKFTCNHIAPNGSYSIHVTARASKECPRDTKNTAKVTAGGKTFSSTATVRILCAKDCPDDKLNSGEQCDDGNLSNTDECLNTCKKWTCGDGFRRSGHEECDDGNANNTDGCSNECKVTIKKGGDCSSGEVPCQEPLVCGRRCAKIDGGCLVCSDQTICGPWKCVPKGEASYLGPF